MIELSPGERLVITGASGWLGTELCELLLQQFGSSVLQTSLICLGSSARTLTLSDGTTLPVHPLDGFTPLENERIAGIVHLGFLTRDKVASLGYDTYVGTNLAITANVIRLIETNSPKWVATVSSGAVHSETGAFLEHDARANPYGFTKRIEEELLANASVANGTNLTIGRLWGALGAFMPINRNYAVSDFIMQALESRKITVRSTRRVFRKYCDAADFMNVLLAAAEARLHTMFDSGGGLVEMSELASAVAEYTGAAITPRDLDDSANPDTYFPKNTDFEILAAQFGIPLRSQDASLRLTVEGHRRRSALRHV